MLLNWWRWRLPRRRLWPPACAIWALEICSGSWSRLAEGGTRPPRYAPKALYNDPRLYGCIVYTSRNLHDPDESRFKDGTRHATARAHLGRRDRGVLCPLR